MYFLRYRHTHLIYKYINLNNLVYFPLYLIVSELYKLFYVKSNIFITKLHINHGTYSCLSLSMLYYNIYVYQVTWLCCAAGTHFMTSLLLVL